MSQSCFTSSGVSAWKNLTEQLPGILNVEFVTDNSSVREVHVLSDQSRSPKQVVRDIQSALLARFQVELDHRVISVAQIPGTPPVAPRRLICERFDLSSDRAGAMVSVTLRLDDTCRKGTSRADLSASGRGRSIALATVSAINQFLLPECSFYFDDIKTVPIGSQLASLVALHLEKGGKSEPLLGACYLGEDPNLSVALATLDGINRRILALAFNTEKNETLQESTE